MGLHVQSGRLAVLTNCRRAPTTVEGFPFEAIERRCHINDQGRVMFTADASRGKVVRDFLEHGVLPPQCPWDSPVMDGYNLLTMDVADPCVRYSTNRYGLEHGAVVADVEGGRSTLAMSNTFINNASEPKVMFLRRIVDDLMSSLSPTMSAECLVEELGGILSDQTAFAVDDDVLLQSKPFLGMSQDARSRLLGRPLDINTDPESIFIGDWSTITEAAAHRSVYVTGPDGTFGTRTQTVVLVEQLDKGRMLHYHQRDTASQSGHGPWVVHRHLFS